MPKSAGPQLVPVHGKDMCSAATAQPLREAQHPEQKAVSECSHTGREGKSLLADADRDFQQSQACGRMAAQPKRGFPQHRAAVKEQKALTIHASKAAY